MGPERALNSLRKALAMGADRAVLISDEGAAGLRPRRHEPDARDSARARAAGPRLFGQQSSDSDGALLWGAVAERLRRPVISQVAELTLDAARSPASARRSSATTYRAPLPAVVAVAGSINGRATRLSRGLAARSRSRRRRSRSPTSVSTPVGPASRGRGPRCSLSPTRRRAATHARSRTTAAVRSRSSRSSSRSG